MIKMMNVISQLTQLMMMTNCTNTAADKWQITDWFCFPQIMFDIFLLLQI